MRRGICIYCQRNSQFSPKYFPHLALHMASSTPRLTDIQLQRGLCHNRHAIDSYRCTLGYFISEITLVASVWLCFRSGGHMLSTQSTWSTCERDQKLHFNPSVSVMSQTFFEHGSRFVTLIKPFTTSYRRCHVMLPLWVAWWGSPA